MESLKTIARKIKKKGARGTLQVIKTKSIVIFNKTLMPIKLQKLVKETKEKYENINLHEIREKTLSYIENMRIKEGPYGQYKYSASQNVPVLYASCYAALTRHLYGDLDRLSKKEREEWINYILSFQDDDGLFKDFTIKNEIAENCDWWGWRHLTLHALMALTALGGKTLKPFAIIKPFSKKGAITHWLETRNWKNDPAHVSNEVQNYGTLLQYARDFQNETWCEDALQEMYNWLDRTQDPKTGLWGNRFNDPISLSNGVQTAYHILLLYFYDRRPIQYMERIIDSCLKTQNQFGGFGVPLNSSACEDIDSIDPLVRFSRLTDYRKKDVETALKKALLWVLVNLNPDGGFVFRRMEPFTYGHYLMSSKKNESAMFPTWFRTLSLAYISKCISNSFLGKFEWQFIKCPGLQFWQE
ncbi:MAG: hypothetical protein PWQ96_2401 [Clostridia bacterium]|nr:hypothetical protein [Rikenellaceae bacterium]MDK2986757.1 hypothetical protein [Clostridia bacterium]